MNNFVVLKVLKETFEPTDENNINNDLNISTDILYSSNKISNSINYIRNLEVLEVNDKNIYINSTHNTPPTNKDIDGLFLVIDKNNGNKYHIYYKRTIQILGYIFNSVEIKTEKIGYLEILKHEINEKQPIVQKQIIKKKSKKPIKENKEQLNHKLILELKEKLKKLQEKKK